MTAVLIDPIAAAREMLERVRSFRPTDDRILVEDLPQKRADGLILMLENPEMVDASSGTTDGSHGNYQRVGITGRVVAVGPGKWAEKKAVRIPIGVEPGEIITYTAWNDLPEGFLPPQYRLIRKNDIWGRS